LNTEAERTKEAALFQGIYRIKEPLVLWP